MSTRASAASTPAAGPVPGRCRRRSLCGLIALPFALALVSCDFTALVGGLYESKSQVSVGITTDSHETKLVLVLGQYGGEVAGHLEMPGHPACPCVYVQGDFTGNELTFESEPDRSPACDLVLTGALELSADRLRGRLYLGTGSKDAFTGDIELVRARTQSELGSEELRGCEE